MVWTVRVEEEGSLLEAAVRRVRLNEPESAIGRRWVEGVKVGGSEDAVLFDVCPRGDQEHRCGRVGDGYNARGGGGDKFCGEEIGGADEEWWD